VKRYAAIAFFQLRVELARRAGASDGPLAVVIARSGGAVTSERSLLGNTRIDEVSSEAWQLGIRPGATIAAARAKHSGLMVRVVQESAAVETLARAAEVALGFGTTTAYSAADDMVLVDVTGCEHLHQSEDDESGVQTLARRLSAQVASLGHAVRVAVAKGPRIAAAFARHARAKDPSLPIVKTSDAAFAKLPLAALPIEPKKVDFLLKMGFRTIDDLRKISPAALAARLGPSAADVMALLRGEDGAPLTPYVPPEVPEERVELEYGIDASEPLLFVAKTLCDRMGARLEGRTRCATHLELVLTLDRALTRERSSEESLPLRLATPIQKSADLMAVLRARVESYVFEAPILAVALRATALCPYELRARDLFVPESRAEVALPRLIAELTAELGEDKVGMFALGDRWLMERRSLLVPPGARAPRAKRLVTRALEPLHFLRRAVSHDPAAAGKKRLLSRAEAIEWWRTEPRAVDHLAVYIPELEALAWVIRNRETGKQAIWGFIEEPLEVTLG
jgi:protein ImuB